MRRTLILAREVLGQLETDELAQVGGGEPPQPTPPQYLSLPGVGCVTCKICTGP